MNKDLIFLILFLSGKKVWQEEKSLSEYFRIGIRFVIF